MNRRLLLSSFCTVALSLAAWGQQQDSLADRMLVYQLPNGAWPKALRDNSAVNYNREITPELRAVIQLNQNRMATIDNSATTREVQALVEAYQKTKNRKYLAAAERGVKYLLEAQYEDGGFPQYYPDSSIYRSQITFNDGAMTNALSIVNKVALAEDAYGVFKESPELMRAAKNAVQRGVACILQLQVAQGDSLSIWAAQYDKNSLKPAQARKFEPVSLASSESVGIVRFLMKQPYDPRIEVAVDAAVRWLTSAEVKGFRYLVTKDSKIGKSVRELNADKTGTVWSRFYDIASNKPIFGDRDNSVTYDYDDISLERKNGYSWFGIWPQELLVKDYPRWKAKLGQRKNSK